MGSGMARAQAERPRVPALAMQPWSGVGSGLGASWRFLGPGAGLGSGARSGPSPSEPALGCKGGLEVRLATTAKEVRRAQRLRFKVFFEEMAAVPSAASRLSRRDADDFDAVCDHLLVLDHDVRPRPFRRSKAKVVGTYRLLRQSVAERHGGFYSAGEYDIGPLLDRHPDVEFLELGRSCVLKPYRSKRTVELLWGGIWAYVGRNRIDAMIGCASLEGTDLGRLAGSLSYLHHHASAPPEWRAAALPGRYVGMDLVSREALDARAAFKRLPALIKGYLRVGATFGDGAVVDRRFGTTDVLAVLPVRAVSERYADHFSPPPDRAAAAAAAIAARPSR